MVTNVERYKSSPLEMVMCQYDNDKSLAARISPEVTFPTIDNWFNLQTTDSHRKYSKFDINLGFVEENIIDNLSVFAHDLSGAIAKYVKDCEILYKYRIGGQKIYEPTFCEWCQKGWEWRDESKVLLNVYCDSNTLRWFYQGT